MRDPRPNILWIVTTQWRASACGYAGDPNARTPCLDALAAESVNYTQAVTPHPFGPFASAAVIVYALWIVAFVLVFLRFSKSAFVVVLLTIPALAWLRSTPHDASSAMVPPTLGFLVLVGLSFLVTIGRPARVGRRAIVTTVAAALLFIVLVMAIRPPVVDGRLRGNIPVEILNAPLLAVILILAGVAFSIARHRSWAAALLVSSTPWLPLGLLFFLPLTPITIVVLAGSASGCVIAAAQIWRHQPVPRRMA